MNEAAILIGKRDPKDIIFLALALSINGAQIWSNDKDFDEQDKVRRISTEALIGMSDEYTAENH